MRATEAWVRAAEWWVTARGIVRGCGWAGTRSVTHWASPSTDSGAVPKAGGTGQLDRGWG